VYAAENQIDPVSRSLKIRATADNSKNLLKPGAFVRVNFNLNVIDNALMIPTEAIVAILKGQQVYTVKNGKAVATPIDIGIRTDTKVQVTNGLAVGDTVLTSGLMGIKPGASVKVSVVR
jgi:membrane fusion protein (multidrug efflux system)